MRKHDFRIRDPFVVPHDGKYYLFGSNGGFSGVTNDSKPIGFDGYTSDNLIDWSEPFAAFRCPENFWGTKDYWAPEVHEYNGSFYMFATFKGEKEHRGTAILKSDSIIGPYKEHSCGAVTPPEWECLDGTLYVSKNGSPYMVFCHEWTQIKDGEICYIELSPDLKASVGQPVSILKASGQPHVFPIHKTTDCFVTDGPFLHRCENGDLLMLWSSFNETESYFVSVMKSSNGEIDGKWEASQEPLFSEDGGHCMLFKTFDGNLKLSLHQPNSDTEHIELFDLTEKDGKLILK